MFYICLFAFPIISLLLMVRSWLVIETAALKKGHIKIAEVLCFIIMVCLVLGGFYLNSNGVEGGMPLHQYEKTGLSYDSYASLSNKHILSIFILFLLSTIAYGVLQNKRGKLSPLIFTVSTILLIANILFTFVYFTHTISIESFFDFQAPMQLGYAMLSFLYITELKHSANAFMHSAQHEEIVYSSKWLRFMQYFRQKYSRLPLLWSIALFPVILVVQLLLVLFGQRPDSFIRVFLDTSSFHYSQLPAPPPIIVPGDGHYLCTVSVRGHRKIVKPLRAGLRHGSRIVVNRQLLVANAFENIIEQYAPRAHKIIRYCYDKYGYPLSRHINQPWSADVVYLLMKPLEWFFLTVLYTVDRNPENRIHRQYSELRK
ncbi:DUF6688 domain-containing protein [Paenibacillus algorifonticola]